MKAPTGLGYPVIAIGDLHGQRDELTRLIEKIDSRPVWKDAPLVFLGDFVDRGPDPRGAIDLVLELLARPQGGGAVRGNHDHALVGAAKLDGGATVDYWRKNYVWKYDCETTFESYGCPPPRSRAAPDDAFEALVAAMPETHKRFLQDLPWVVEMEGHVFLHNGLSPELEASAEEQVVALHGRKWERERMRPRAGTDTVSLWTPAYPVWLGAAAELSPYPLPHPTKVQVTGHVWVATPDATTIRIRIDTSAGTGDLTACLLRAPRARPEFLSSDG